MVVEPSERGRRSATPAALSTLGPVVQGFRILPDPLYGQPLLRVPVKPLHVRVRLDRSHESAQAAEPTQDYLAVRCDPRRLSFAVTDGVGSSFLGDVAAQILAAHLADWLGSVPSLNAKAVTACLQDLSRDMADRVAAWPIPSSVSALVRGALDQQRAYGSEAMFVAGFVDLSSGRDAMAAVAWLGDSRLRVVMRDGTTLDHCGQTADRWSSRVGPRGDVRCRVWPVANVARIIACTDGLVPELEATTKLPDDQLRLRLDALARRPGNDDIALVDIGLGPRAMPPAQTGSALWRRLTEEPRGRHAHTTVAGTALRRLMRAVKPVVDGPSAAGDAGVAPPPGVASAAGGPQPGSGPRAGVGPQAGGAVPPGLAPRAGGASHGGGAHQAGEGSPPGGARQAGGASPAGVTPRVGVEPPAAVRWGPSGRTYEVSWSPVAKADSYSVEVCTEPTFAEPLLYAVKGTTFVVPPIAGDLFVRLRSVAANEPGPWGAAHGLSGPPNARSEEATP